MQTRSETEKIVDLQLEQLRRRLHERLRAAHLQKRFLQRELETRIGRALVAGQIAEGTKITIALEKGVLAIKHENRS